MKKNTFENCIYRRLAIDPFLIGQTVYNRIDDSVHNEQRVQEGQRRRPGIFLVVARSKESTNDGHQIIGRPQEKIGKEDTGSLTSRDLQPSS